MSSQAVVQWAAKDGRIRPVCGNRRCPPWPGSSTSASGKPGGGWRHWASPGPPRVGDAGSSGDARGYLITSRRTAYPAGTGSTAYFFTAGAGLAPGAGNGSSASFNTRPSPADIVTPHSHASVGAMSIGRGAKVLPRLDALAEQEQRHALVVRVRRRAMPPVVPLLKKNTAAGRRSGRRCGREEVGRDCPLDGIVDGERVGEFVGAEDAAIPGVDRTASIAASIAAGLARSFSNTPGSKYRSL